MYMILKYFLYLWIDVDEYLMACLHNLSFVRSIFSHAHIRIRLVSFVYFLPG